MPEIMPMVGSEIGGKKCSITTVTPKVRELVDACIDEHEAEVALWYFISFEFRKIKGVECCTTLCGNCEELQGNSEIRKANMKHRAKHSYYK